MCRPGFRRLEVQKAPGRNYQGVRPRRGKVLEIAGHQVIRTCGMGAFQKNIVVRVGARLDRLRWPHPETFLADSLQRRGYHFFIAREARPPDYFFVLGINTSAYAQFNPAARHKQKHRCERAEGCNNAETMTFVSRTTRIMSLS